MFDNIIIGADDAKAGRDALALAQQLAAPHGQVTLAYVQVGAPPPDPDSAAMSLAADRQPVVEALRSLRDESHLDAARRGRRRRSLSPPGSTNSPTDMTPTCS